jgi:hypothetical protein
MSNIERKISGVEKLFNNILPTIYPHITNIQILKNDTDGNRYPEYDLIIDTDLPNTVTKDEYWDNEFWETNQMFDYHYMNDVIMPELLEYFSIKDAEFDRRIKIYNIDKELIITAPLWIKKYTQR